MPKQIKIPFISKEVIEYLDILFPEKCADLTDNDKEIFYDYLLTNVKLNFDTYETDLQKSLPEPTTPEYEKEKDKLDTPDEPSPEDELAPPPELPAEEPDLAI